VKASNSEFQDGFGTSLSLDGDTLAVGAPLEKSCATGINGNQADNGCTDAGAVYVFVRTNGLWSQQAYLKQSNTGPGDRFGFGVSIDADTLAVGAPLEASCALGINGDQLNNACAGAGAGYVFTRSTDACSQQAYLKASNTSSSSIPAIPGDGFGSALAFHGDSLAVGAPGEASCAMGIESDQTNRGCPRAGALYLFNRDGNVWSQEAYIKPSDTAAGDQFGSSVALNDDTLVVGAPFESSCATGVNGDQNQLGCFATGAVYVFNTRGEQTYVKPSYTRMPQPRFNPSDEFGFSVAINGGTLAVGAQKEASCATGVNGDAANSQCFGAGAAYVYVAP
jgi:hypothetical protein